MHEKQRSNVETEDDIRKDASNLVYIFRHPRKLQIEIAEDDTDGIYFGIFPVPDPENPEPESLIAYVWPGADVDTVIIRLEEFLRSTVEVMQKHLANLKASPSGVLNHDMVSMIMDEIRENHYVDMSEARWALH